MFKKEFLETVTPTPCLSFLPCSHSHPVGNRSHQSLVYPSYVFYSSTNEPMHVHFLISPFFLNYIYHSTCAVFHFAFFHPTLYPGNHPTLVHTAFPHCLKKQFCLTKPHSSPLYGCAIFYSTIKIFCDYKQYCNEDPCAYLFLYRWI